MVDGKPGGLVVHAGARLLGLAESGQVLVSSSAHDVVPGAGIRFADLGELRLKGLDAPMHVYSVTGIEGEPLAPPEPGAVDARLSAIQGSPVAEGRRWALLAAGALALVVAAWVVLGGRVEQPAAKVTGTSASEVGGSRAPVPLGSVAELDPSTGEVRTLVPFPLVPQFIDIAHTMTAGLGAVWIVRDKTSCTSIRSTATPRNPWRSRERPSPRPSASPLRRRRVGAVRALLVPSQSREQRRREGAVAGAPQRAGTVPGTARVGGRLGLGRDVRRQAHPGRLHLARRSHPDDDRSDRRSGGGRWGRMGVGSARWCDHPLRRTNLEGLRDRAALRRRLEHDDRRARRSVDPGRERWRGHRYHDEGIRPRR